MERLEDDCIFHIGAMAETLCLMHFFSCVSWMSPLDTSVENALVGYMSSAMFPEVCFYFIMHVNEQNFVNRASHVCFLSVHDSLKQYILHRSCQGY